MLLELASAWFRVDLVRTDASSSGMWVPVLQRKWKTQPRESVVAALLYDPRLGTSPASRQLRRPREQARIAERSASVSNVWFVPIALRILTRQLSNLGVHRPGHFRGSRSGIGEVRNGAPMPLAEMAEQSCRHDCRTGMNESRYAGCNSSGRLSRTAGCRSEAPLRQRPRPGGWRKACAVGRDMHATRPPPVEPRINLTARQRQCAAPNAPWSC